MSHPREAGRRGFTTTALITGASHGVGLEVARQLGESGVRVVVAAREPHQAEGAVEGLSNVEALPVGLDVSDVGSVHDALDAVAAQVGGLDILVNNAAAHPDRSETATTADLTRAAGAFEVTLFGTWRMTQAALPLLGQSSHPRIVNVSSGAGSHTDPQFGFATSGGAFPSHTISKAGVNALTAALAAELADTPIIINAVCPGFVATRPELEQAGARPVADGAAGIVWAATLPDDGPRGGFFRDGQPLGW